MERAIEKERDEERERERLDEEQNYCINTSYFKYDMETLKFFLIGLCNSN